MRPLNEENDPLIKQCFSYEPKYCYNWKLNAAIIFVTIPEIEVELYSYVHNTQLREYCIQYIIRLFTDSAL